MLNMIKADFYRVFKGKAIYIGIALMVLMIGMSVYMISPGTLGDAEFSVNGDTVSSGVSATEPFEDMTYEEMQGFSMSDYRAYMLKLEGYQFDIAMLAQNMNLYYIFIFVAALAIAVDFSGGSVKNTLSSAISRNKYFLSKTMFTMIACLLLFFANTYISYFANLVCNGKNLASDIGTVTKISLLQLPAILALVSILNGIGFMAKKTSIFNTISIALVMVFQLIMNVTVVFLGLGENIIQYELQTMFHNLCYNPSVSYIAKSYAVCGAIIVGFHLLGYLSFRKAEIK